ncbi:hypothetical protein HNQ02_001312 [Flavobacterium sp. 7E]|nr:hypothetical protein [Flavobacterium sp. 7E]
MIDMILFKLLVDYYKLIFFLAKLAKRPRYLINSLVL